MRTCSARRCGTIFFHSADRCDIRNINALHLSVAISAVPTPQRNCVTYREWGGEALALTKPVRSCTRTNDHVLLPSMYLKGDVKTIQNAWT